MPHIPVELKESLKKGECVLFVGAGLSEGLPNWEELIQLLADELKTSVDKDLRKTASYYENEFGRPRLEGKIVSELKKEVPLTRTHEILANFPLKAIVTTNYDPLLEKALSQKKRNVFKVVYGTEVPHIGADQLQLIKMHGDLDYPSTIVITKKDYDEYAEKHKALITHLLGLLITCNFLFVGFSLEDPNFDNIYTQIKTLFGKEKRTSFAIFKNPPPHEVRRLKNEMGIEVISVEDFAEIPHIFEELHAVCSQPYTQAALTPFERENIHNTFCEVVKRQNKWLDPRGIFQFEKMLTKNTVELEDVYVVPRLIKEVMVRKKKKGERREEVEPDSSQKDEYTEKLDPEEKELEEYVFEKEISLPLKDALSTTENTHMVILGEPGVGKTCLLRYIVLKTSTASELLGINPALPVLIPLREYKEYGQAKTLREFIFYYIKNRICSLPDTIVEDFLERNSFFFLFDGLDEVVSESERISISRQVEQFMGQYPHTRIILTSRPAGYRTAPLIGAIPHFTLAEFNDDEIKEFLVKWFAFLEKVEEGTYEEAVIEKKANELAQIIIETERILRLARNPLLLTILVLIHRVGKKLPERRAEFYEYAVKTVAGTWDSWKKLYTDKKIPDEEVIISILEKVGFKLHSEKEENVVEVGELKTWVKEALEEELGHSSREEVNNFVWMLNERAGLLVERGLGLYGFVHLTFQEYFAARYITWGKGTSEAQNLIKEKLYFSRWREVFLLAAALAPSQQADVIFDGILKAENDFEEYIHSNLIFAGEALADLPRISGSKRRDIIDRLVRLTGSDTVDLLRYEAIRVLTGVRRVFQFEDRWALELLRDGDSDVRWLVMEYFIQIGAEDTETKNRIFELLGDATPHVRAQVMEYFTKIGARDAKTKNKFLKLLSDENSFVHFLAAQYFTKIGAEDTETKNRILELLRDKDWNVRVLAAQYFTKIGAEDTETKNEFFELLRDENATFRWLAMEYFIQIGARDAKTTNKFFELLYDEKSDVRGPAVGYFTKIGLRDAKTTNRLFELLRDENANVCWLAVEYFTKIGAEDTETKNEFFELLRDENANVRGLAVEYFTKIGARDAKTTNRLFELLRDENANVRGLAVEYFTKIGARDAKTTNRLFELLRDENANVRGLAVEYFTKIGARDAKTTNRLFELLRDENATVRGLAVEYFTKIGARDAKTTNRLFELLRDENATVRGLAVEYFTKIGARDAKTTNRLFELLRDEDWNVRGLAVEYFTKLGARDAKTKNRFFELLYDEDWNVCGPAVEYFTKIGAEDTETRNRIFELLRDELFSIYSNKSSQDFAVDYLSKYAREESREKAPLLFNTKDESTRRGAYKLMKALLTIQ